MHFLNAVRLTSLGTECLRVFGATPGAVPHLNNSSHWKRPERARHNSFSVSGKVSLQVSGKAFYVKEQQELLDILPELC